MKGLLLSALLISWTLHAAVPEVSKVTISQNPKTSVTTVTYQLKDSSVPAIVTVDFVTNAQNGAGVSIGADKFANVAGDVNRIVVPGKSDYTIVWDSRTSWPGMKIRDESFRAVVTAWAIDAPPDYLVARLDEPTNVAFYVSAAALPGGLLSNDDYKTNSLVLKRVHTPASGSFSMGIMAGSGSTAESKFHPATLTNDYYLGVFELTQAQLALTYGKNLQNQQFTSEANAAVLPACGASFAEMYFPYGRMGYSDIAKDARLGADAVKFLPPALGHDGSVLGKIRLKTGLNVVLPTETQWEYAAKAGHDETHWGDGSLCYFVDSTYDPVGRFKADKPVCVGSYAPNDFGFYDMIGNVSELCQDYYEANVTGYDGALNVLPTDPTKTLSKGGSGGGNRSCRGGSYASTINYYLQAGCRTQGIWTTFTSYSGQGVRVAHPIDFAHLVPEEE